MTWHFAFCYFCKRTKIIVKTRKILVYKTICYSGRFCFVWIHVFPIFMKACEICSEIIEILYNLFIFRICNKIWKMFFYEFFLEQVAVCITIFECLHYLLAKIFLNLFQYDFIRIISLAFWKKWCIFFQRIILIINIFHFEFTVSQTHCYKSLVVVIYDYFHSFIFFRTLFILSQ